MKCNFVVGQKVVCVCENWVPGRPGFDDHVPHPRKDRIYTVGGLGPVSHLPGLQRCADEIFVSLKELGETFWYHHSNFRALQKRQAETDIGVFTSLLDTAPKELEPA
jgi:hypothetical protein